MITQSKKILGFALCLTALAGFIDALGFITLKGFFVSFMSGNSTRFAVNFFEHGFSFYSFLPIAIITLFVIGVMTGALIGHFARERRALAVLAFMTAMLTGAALSHMAGFDTVAIIMIILAMGAENNIFVKEGEVSVGLTYMTGTLVKIGQKLAGGFIGRSRTAWIPYFVLWSGLIGGAILGACSFTFMGLHSLWIAAAFAGMLMASCLTGQMNNMKDS